MNNKKFCFIICTNNDLMLEESIHYINHISIPTGYELDLLTINDAPSITQGYNEAMAASDARYKIYMHQDVFILNKNILSDLLGIFRSNPQVGLIGMIGYDIISPDGIMWRQKYRGNLYSRFPDSRQTDYHYSLKDDGFGYAAQIDGFFMATSRDLPWDTERLKGWDFYDAFQSINFLTHGYQIAVPEQKCPWCMHDDGKILNVSHYNHYRHIFMQTYERYLGKHWTEIIKKP